MLTHIIQQGLSKTNGQLVGSTQSDLTKLFQGLFPSWPTVLATMLSITVLLIVMTKYLWKPMKKYVTNRHDFIQANIDNSTQQKIDAINDRKIAGQELDDAKVEAANIVNIAKTEAANVKNDIINHANEQSKQLLEAAQAEMVREKARLKTESKDEIITIAFAAAEKIIGKNVDSQTNKKIIEDYIKQND